MWSNLRRLVALLFICGVSLQLFFLARVALMIVCDPQSTTFQRSEIVRLALEQHHVAWSQEWRPYERIANPLKKAVIASEDAGFVEHTGVEWDALEKAWERNQRAEERARRINEEREARAARQAERLKKRAERRGLPPPEPASVPAPKLVHAKVVGGSTITQQLAKNLFLSAERNALRKGQEFVITFMLEGLLSKQRILEIYLNNVEWGEGVFGAQAAARHYFRADAEQLGTWQAARLAVMLPAPKRFEKNPNSGFVMARAGAVAARSGAVDLP